MAMAVVGPAEFASKLFHTKLLSTEAQASKIS